MGVDELCLTWDDHHRTLIGVFETLLENGTLVDCTIAAEGQYLKAHKVILSSCSPYFEMLFTQESEKNPIVVLKDIKFQDLKALIDFIYRGKVQIPEDRLQDFTDAAESLQIKGLGGGHKRNVCEKKGRESPKALGKESFGRKRNSSSFPTTEENKTESTNATISNKSPRLENIDPNQMTDGSASLLPLSASDSPPTPPQREVQKESSETMPSTASQSATEPDLQPIAEVYVPETWIEPKSEVCEEEVSMDGSENGGEGAMLEGGEEYENFAFPSPLEVVKEESDNSVLLDPVSESSDPPGQDIEDIGPDENLNEHLIQSEVSLGEQNVITNVKSWKQEVRKKLRNSGKSYVTPNGKIVKARSLKPFVHNCRYGCSEHFSEDDRKSIFDNFWRMGSWNLQTSFISSCVSLIQPKQPRSQALRPRSVTNIICLQGKRVCKEFFLKTLDISGRRFITACNKKRLSEPHTDCRGRYNRSMKIPQERKEEVKSHIASFSVYKND